VACFNATSGDDEPSNSHSLLNPRRPDGGRFRGRYAHLMQTGAWAGLQVLSRRQTAGSVGAASGLIEIASGCSTVPALAFLKMARGCRPRASERAEVGHYHHHHHDAREALLSAASSSNSR
jgi:hypothetical protein